MPLDSSGPPESPGEKLDATEFRALALVPGTRYRVLRLLGQGGMGRVYEVEHIELGKRFVLKALLRDLASRRDLVARLRTEWRALGQLNHPNIVDVTDAGVTENGVPFFVMERLEGETLGQRLRRVRRVPVGEALSIGAAVLDGLSAAHAIGIVHRDVKPPNVFLRADGGVKLLDFGVAKIASQTESITVRGVAIGTPKYMSPEQARGDAVDGRADLYATGLLIYEMIAGDTPFEDVKDSGSLLLAHIMTEPPLLSSAAPDVSPALDALVASLLAKDPAARPESAQGAAQALRALIERRPSRLPPPQLDADSGEVTAQRPRASVPSTTLVMALDGTPTQLRSPSVPAPSDPERTLLDPMVTGTHFDSMPDAPSGAKLTRRFGSTAAGSLGTAPAASDTAVSRTAVEEALTEAALRVPDPTPAGRTRTVRLDELDLPAARDSGEPPSTRTAIPVAPTPESPVPRVDPRYGGTDAGVQLTPPPVEPSPRSAPRTRGRVGLWALLSVVAVGVVIAVWRGASLLGGRDTVSSSDTSEAATQVPALTQHSVVNSAPAPLDVAPLDVGPVAAAPAAGPVVAPDASGLRALPPTSAAGSPARVPALPGPALPSPALPSPASAGPAPARALAPTRDRAAPSAPRTSEPARTSGSPASKASRPSSGSNAGLPNSGL
jgi:serine/threonine protein kinase